jgi:exopolysaccharide biosynthesis WecB/TagA/CpsF family protein
MTLTLPPDSASLSLGGVRVDLLEFDEAVDVIAARSRSTAPVPLGVVSINLDHIHHFGSGTSLGGDFGLRAGPVATVDWLNLVDGAPLVSEARRRTLRSWPRLAGSDLIGAILDNAERDGVTIGFLGGSAETHRVLRTHLGETRPRLRLAGCWAPSRAELADAERSCEIADEIAEAGVDVLIVCLGKPRQELWIDHYGALTGARVLLAFGAVVDFLAGRVGRAPRAVADHGFEWAWRLAREPRRLARRYLIDGPPAYLALRREKSSLRSAR